MADTMPHRINPKISASSMGSCFRRSRRRWGNNPRRGVQLQYDLRSLQLQSLPDPMALAANAMGTISAMVPTALSMAVWVVSRLVAALMVGRRRLTRRTTAIARPTQRPMILEMKSIFSHLFILSRYRVFLSPLKPYTPINSSRTIENVTTNLTNVCQVGLAIVARTSTLIGINKYPTSMMPREMLKIVSTTSLTSM